MTQEKKPNDYIIDYCIYTPKSPPNNYASYVIDLITTRFIYLPAMTLSATISYLISTPAKLFTEIIFAIADIADISITFKSPKLQTTIKELTYSSIAIFTSQTLGCCLASLFTSNLDTINGMGILSRAASFIASYTFSREYTYNYVNTIKFKWGYDEFDQIHTVITNGIAIATCPIIMTAKAIDLIALESDLTFYNKVDIELDKIQHLLFTAIKNSKLADVTTILASLNDTNRKEVLTKPDIKIGEKCHALTLAALGGNMEIFKLIIDEFKKIAVATNYPDLEGKTALMIAAALNNLPIFKFLLDLYAESGSHININDIDIYGNNAFHYIATIMLRNPVDCEDQCIKIAKILIDGGVNVNKKNIYGATAIEIIEIGDASIVQAQYIANLSSHQYMINKAVANLNDISTYMSKYISQYLLPSLPMHSHFMKAKFQTLFEDQHDENHVSPNEQEPLISETYTIINNTQYEFL